MAGLHTLIQKLWSEKFSQHHPPLFLLLSNTAAFVLGRTFRFGSTLSQLRAECLVRENQLMFLVPSDLNKVWHLHTTCPITLTSFCSVKSADMLGPVVSCLKLSLPGLQSAQTSPPHVNWTILFATNWSLLTLVTFI